MRNQQISFVLTLGGERSPPAYFYVHIFTSTDGRTTIVKLNSHRLASIANKKHRVFVVSGRPTNIFRLSQNINRCPLAENLNLIRSHASNGTSLYCVPQ